MTGYVREFRHKLTNHISDLESHIVAETATARERKALKTAQEALADINSYERDIRLPLSQKRLEIDLDDGVRVNYPKFGKALANIAGMSEE